MLMMEGRRKTFGKVSTLHDFPFFCHGLLKSLSSSTVCVLNRSTSDNYVFDPAAKDLWWCVIAKERMQRSLAKRVSGQIVLMRISWQIGDSEIVKTRQIRSWRENSQFGILRDLKRWLSERSMRTAGNVFDHANGKEKSMYYEFIRSRCANCITRYRKSIYAKQKPLEIT